MSVSVSGRLRPELERLRPYHVPDASGLIKLDAMENPYEWPREIKEEWLQTLLNVQPNRYPDPACHELKALLRRYCEVPDGVELLLGNGSDEIIQILLMALPADATVMAPEPTFVMYRQIAESLGLQFIGVPLEKDGFDLDFDRFKRLVDQHDPALIFLAYPNNPTGNLFSRSKVSALMKSSKGFVVLDEAYTPFAGDSFMSEILDFPNLLVMRTLSKLGLAGLRLGFLCGPAEPIAEFEKLRLPYNINTLTQVTAGFALKHAEMLNHQVIDILRDREGMRRVLDEMPGVQVFDSKANFLLLKIENDGASRVFEGLRERGILIKNLSSQGGLLSGCLRVTVGTPKENDRFLSAFQALIHCA